MHHPKGMRSTIATDYVYIQFPLKCAKKLASEEKHMKLLHDLMKLELFMSDYLEEIFRIDLHTGEHADIYCPLGERLHIQVRFIYFNNNKNHLYPNTYIPLSKIQIQQYQINGPQFC